MAVVQTKFGTKAVSSVDHSVTFDAAPTEGNLLVASIHHRNTSICGNILLAGWTEIACITNSAVSKMFFKRASAGESSTVTITTNGIPASGVMWIVELDDVDVDDAAILDDSVTDSNGAEVATLIVGDITITAPIVQILCFVGVRAGGDAGSFAFTNSFTKQDDGESSGASPSGGGGAYRQMGRPPNTINSVATWTDVGRPTGIMASFVFAEIEPPGPAAATVDPRYGQVIIDTLDNREYGQLVLKDTSNNRPTYGQVIVRET